MIEALLWDNDGVLIDTEGLFFQATRDVFALRHELLVCGAVVLMRHNEGFAVAETTGGAAQVLEDRFAEKRFFARPMDVAQFAHEILPVIARRFRRVAHRDHPSTASSAQAS